MLGFYTSPLSSAACPSDVPANLANLRQDGGQTRDCEIVVIRRAIVEAEIRVEALSTVITEAVKAGCEAREAERLWAAELDRLQDLRSDFGALCFVGDFTANDDAADLELLRA